MDNSIIQLSPTHLVQPRLSLSWSFSLRSPCPGPHPRSLPWGVPISVLTKCLGAHARVPILVPCPGSHNWVTLGWTSPSPDWVSPCLGGVPVAGECSQGGCPHPPWISLSPVNVPIPRRCSCLRSVSPGWVPPCPVSIPKLDVPMPGVCPQGLSSP